eukprot:1202125-Pyramimonas_sp.AAC.2
MLASLVDRSEPARERLRRQLASSAPGAVGPKQPKPSLVDQDALVRSAPTVGALGHPAIVGVTPLQLGLRYQVKLMYPAECPQHPDEWEVPNLPEDAPPAPDDVGALVRPAEETCDMFPARRRACIWVGPLLLPDQIGMGRRAVKGGRDEVPPRDHSNLAQLVLQQKLLLKAVVVQPHPREVGVVHGAGALGRNGDGAARLIYKVGARECRPDFRSKHFV